MPNVQQGYVPFSVPTGNPPDCRIGRQAIHVLIDFSLGTTYSLDLTAIQNTGKFDSVQTLYIDNSGNTGALTVNMSMTLQKVIIPAGAQAYIPVLNGNPPVLSLSVSTGTPIVNVQILNFFVPPGIWYTTGFPVTDLTLAAVISNGGVNVNATPLTVTAPTDGSGTIAVGGTAQVLFAANAARKRWTLCNPSSATEILQFAYGNTGHYIDLQPGTTWNEADFSVSGDAIYVVAATATHAFTAYEW